MMQWALSSVVWSCSSTCTWRYPIEPDVFHLFTHQAPFIQLWLICSFADIGSACLLVPLLEMPASHILLRPSRQDYITPTSLHQLTRPGVGTWLNRANYVHFQSFVRIHKVIFCYVHREARYPDVQKERWVKQMQRKAEMSDPVAKERKRHQWAAALVLNAFPTSSFGPQEAWLGTLLVVLVIEWFLLRKVAFDLAIWVHQLFRPESHWVLIYFKV